MAEDGKISLLGLGSNNVLNKDLITKMRKADESVQILPVERRMDTIDFKVERLEILNDKVKEMNTVVKELGNELTYLKVSAYTNNNNVWVDASTGVKPQDFTVNVTQKARADMFQSNKLNTLSAPLTGTSETLKYNISNGPAIEVAIPANSSLEDIRNILNDTGDMSATILKVSSTEYRLSIKSAGIGEDSSLSFSSDPSALETSLGLTDTNNHIQASQNSLFSFNGIDMERSSNTISDIISGVELELTDLGETQVEIKPNYEKIVENMNTFASLYNETNALVKSNLTGAEEHDGLFRTSREVRDIMKSLNDGLFKLNENNPSSTLKSMVDVGFEKLKDGTLKFDQSVLEEALLNNFDELSELFSDEETGVFSKLEETTKSITNVSKTGSLDQLNKSLGKEDDRLSELLERNKTKIERQYALIEKRFASFDALISKMESGFSALKLQMEQSVAKVG